MSHSTIILVFQVSDKVQHKHGCTAQKMAIKGLKISDLRSRGIVLSVAKTKELISCMVTAQLISPFVIEYAKSRFSHDKALKIS